jgi:hypothetical protein
VQARHPCSPGPPSAPWPQAVRARSGQQKGQQRPHHCSAERRQRSGQQQGQRHPHHCSAKQRQHSAPLVARRSGLQAALRSGRPVRLRCGESYHFRGMLFLSLLFRTCVLQQAAPRDGQVEGHGHHGRRRGAARKVLPDACNNRGVLLLGLHTGGCGEQQCHHGHAEGAHGASGRHGLGQESTGREGGGGQTGIAPSTQTFLGLVPRSLIPMSKYRGDLLYPLTHPPGVPPRMGWAPHRHPPHGQRLPSR